MVYTKPRHEKKVATRLSEMGIDYFLPTTKKLRTWSDRKKYIDEPIFPSYVFVLLKDKQGYFNSLEAEGLLYYIRLGKEISRVDDVVINNIRLLVCNGKAVEPATADFRKGENLVISTGPLTGLACEVISYNGRQKILVRVNLLNRSLIADVPVSVLQPA